MATDSQLLGIAGVHLACAELTLMGYITTMTSRNTEGIDMFVSNKDGSRTRAIQVKTTRKNKDWFLSEKAEKMSSDNLFYILVDLNKENKADFHIVPSKIIADYVKADYKKYINTPNRKGEQHKETSCRTFLDKENKYLNCWELLDLN